MLVLKFITIIKANSNIRFVMEVEKIKLVVISGIFFKENGDGELMVLDLWMVTADW